MVTKTKAEATPNEGRRNFLKLATTAAPAAVAAAALSGTATEAEANAPRQGLQDTAHTSAYFASARF
ncbi:twin-arginine translocation signal domain-containing protein [Pseudorhodobacter ferrugineus]|uniref:twin-arginine translocation signal domain-containing protein n=1 Tax=Pseudorhodobacter ferrugineus TaxID=77008 RepID=UPI0004171C63|nr:twin-arginine translocation signal domain-containing protein [Pseudorhodobacter ferrugineus]